MELYALARPFLAALDPETAHRLTIRALRLGIGAPSAPPDPPALEQTLMDLRFPNPIGLAAGFDKNAEVPDAMLRLGFGFTEIGTVTPRPQAGNPRPRLFRLPEDGAVINRMGFNNDGARAARARLAGRAGLPGLVGANIGANKSSDDKIQDYVEALTLLGPVASYLTVNISSPNTPGLRGLQDRDPLARLVKSLTATRAANALSLPILLKIAPDLDQDALGDIVEIALDHKIDGLILTNTTIVRDGLKSGRAHETGGLSGRPLFAPSTALLRAAARLAAGRLVLVGAGGISSGADAYAKIRAGASLVQLYTALAYQGPGLVSDIKRDLLALLARDGYSRVGDAVGADLRGGGP